MISNPSLTALAVVRWLLLFVAPLELIAAPQEINPPQAPDVNRVVAIVGATLVDGTGAAPVSNSCVIIRGNRIILVGTNGMHVPPGAQVFNASGMCLLPGLLDAHFHIERDYALPGIYLSHGITSVRDPGQWLEIYEPIQQTNTPQPRCFVAGPHLDGSPPAHPGDAFVVKDAIETRSAVDRFIDEGASHMKVYFRLPIELIKVACDSAHARGVPVTAHLELVDADAAIQAGLDGIEHVTSVGTALAEPSEAERFRETVRVDNEARRKARYELWSKLDLAKSPRVERIINLLVLHKIFFDPTLAVFERRRGDKGVNETEARAFENMLQFVRLCHGAGVRIVVGSHSSVPKAERGRAYQRELELLVECGLTPSEAITAASFQNARFFNAEKRLGSITPGKLADLLLIRGDVTKDVKLMRNITRVMLNGSWVP